MKVLIVVSSIVLLWLVLMVLEKCRFCGRIRPRWKMEEIDKWAHEDEYECTECLVMRKLMGKKPGFKGEQKGH